MLRLKKIIEDAKNQDAIKAANEQIILMAVKVDWKNLISIRKWLVSSSQENFF